MQNQLAQVGQSQRGFVNTNGPDCNHGKLRLNLVFISAVADQAFFATLLSVWRKHGYALEIWSEMSERDYRNARGFTSRLGMRFRINVLFPLRVGLLLLLGGNRRGRILIVTSTPFFMATIAGFLKRRTDAVCQMLYDLYPDALVVAGKIDARSVTSAVIGWTVSAGMRRCELTVFPGERLRRYAEKTYGPCPCSISIPVGSDGAHLRFERDDRKDELINVVYVGNFGYMHDYRTLADLLRAGLPHGIKVTFYASGYNYERFKSASVWWPKETRDRVVFENPLGHEQWLQVMKKGEVGLVLFVEGAEKVAFPSKTFSAMAAGQAILAVTPLASDLADIVASNNCGWVVGPGDVAGLRAHMEEMIRNHAILKQKQIAAAEAAFEKYDVASLALQWMGLFQRLQANIENNEKT